MTRNERIREQLTKAEQILWQRRKWVSVTVAPGYTCNAPFTTLDPEDHEIVMRALNDIRRELEGKR